ncbi:MAG: MFS transporter [Thermomicrobiales bacterium]
MAGTGVAAAENSPATAAKSIERAAPVVLPFAFSLAILFFGYWTVDIVSPALPAIQESLAMSATGAGLVFSVFFVGRLATNIPAAWMAGRLGTRWTALAGAVALLVGSLGAGLSATEMMLLPARVAQGVGTSLLATAGLMAALRARPERGAAMTAFNMATGVGGSVGLLLGGFLTNQFGWRSIFLLSAALASVLLLGSLLVRGRPAPTTPARPGAADVEPVTTSRAGQAAASVGNLLVFANYSIWVVALPLLAAERFGFNPGQVGLLLLFVNILHVLSAVPAGRAVRRFGGTMSLAAGYGLSGLGILLVPWVPTALWLAGPLTLYAIGQMIGNVSGGDLILRLGGGGGRAVGTVRLTSDIGLVGGPAAVGVLADAAGVTAPFMALGVVMLTGMAVAVLISWRLPPRRPGLT